MKIILLLFVISVSPNLRSEAIGYTISLKIKWILFSDNFNKSNNLYSSSWLSAISVLFCSISKVTSIIILLELPLIIWLLTQVSLLKWVINFPTSIKEPLNVILKSLFCLTFPYILLM